MRQKKNATDAGERNTFKQSSFFRLTINHCLLIFSDIAEEDRIKKESKRKKKKKNVFF